MRRETILMVVLAMSAVWFFLLANGHLPTGAAVKSPCAGEVLDMTRICSGGASPECAMARENYRLCMMAQEKKTWLPPPSQDCELKETGKKRCDNEQTIGLGRGYDKVLKELKDPKKSACNAQWALDQYCETGTTCKGGNCVGVSCATNRDCTRYNGRACREGICVAYCEDSDEKNPQPNAKKGVTKSFIGRARTEDDFCFNQDTLVEWFCDPAYDPNRPGVKYINYDKVFCDNGCFQGACRKT